MPDLLEQLYCAQQIVVPPTLPSILKKYAKAAIRTQPCDLLVWSSAYFRALSKGLPPPAKDRLEYPPIETPSGLTPGFLKILITQLGKGETVAKDDLVESWAGICLNAQALHDLLEIGMFEDEVKWLEFIAICAGTLQPSLTKTMIHLCELLTEEPEGGRASIPVEIFLTAYKFLAKLDCGPVNTRKQYELMMKEDSEEQCPSEEDKPMEEEEQSEVPVIDWDQAIEALNDRDSDNTVKTRPSDDGMIVWPDIKVEEKEELSAMELVEKEVTSEDGIAVFTEVETQPFQEELKICPEPQPEAQQEASEDEENIFAPKIDSLAGLVESEADVIVDTDAPLVPSSTSDSELLNHSSASIRSASERGSVMAASSSRNAEISNAYEMEEAEGEVQEGREEKPQQFDMKKEVDVKCLVKKDSEMMLLPTPVTSDVMLYVDNCDEPESNKIASSQELVQKMTLLDVHVDIPIDETVEEVMTPFQHPKWMHIPGIGPAVPEDTIAAAEKYFLAVSELQEGMVMPRNIRNFQCPPLELIPDCTPEIDAYTEVPHQA